MDYKDKYKKYVNNNFEPRDDFEKLCNEIGVKDMKKKTVMTISLATLASAVVVGGVVIGFTMNKKPKNNIDKMVTLSLNNDNVQKLSTDLDKTDITLNLDKNGKVVSVYGNDQLAQMVLVDENLVGKDVNEALKTIIDIEVNTGLIIKGSVSASQNALEISVSCELSEEAQQYVTQLKETIEQKIKDLNIKASIEEVKGMMLDEIKKELLEINPDADVENMTYEDMLKEIAIHKVEMASLYSQQLEELYLDAKEYKIEFAEKEVTKQVVDKLDGVYQVIKTAYSEAIDALDVAITKVNEVKYEAVIDPNSDFQKAYQDLTTKLNDLIVAKNNIDIDDNAAVIEYKAKKAAYELSLTAMDAAEAGVSVICDSAVKVLEAAKDVLTSLEEKLPAEIKTQINEQLKKEEAKLNELKDKAFEEFEKAHKDDINRMKEQLKEQKEQLIEAIKKA